MGRLGYRPEPGRHFVMSDVNSVCREEGCGGLVRQMMLSAGSESVAAGQDCRKAMVAASPPTVELRLENLPIGTLGIVATECPACRNASWVHRSPTGLQTTAACRPDQGLPVSLAVMRNHRQRGPSTQVTKLRRVPPVTGRTRCARKEGKINMLPFGTKTFPGLGAVRNSNVPPS